jgi:hypothetical protein
LQTSPQAQPKNLKSTRSLSVLKNHELLTDCSLYDRVKYNLRVHNDIENHEVIKLAQKMYQHLKPILVEKILHVSLNSGNPRAEDKYTLDGNLTLTVCERVEQSLKQCFTQDSLFAGFSFNVYSENRCDFTHFYVDMVIKS